MSSTDNGATERTMSEFTRVVIETDASGRRVMLGALDSRGVGRGHRFGGPAYRDVDQSDELHTIDLDGRDASALIEHGAILSRIALGDHEPVMDELMNAARHFLDDAAVYHDPARASAAEDDWARLYERRRRELRNACLAVVAELDARPEVDGEAAT